MKQVNQSPDDILEMKEISSESRQGMPTVYAAINAGHLETFLIGRRRYARRKAFRAWLDHLEAESKAGRPVVYRARGQAA